MAKQIPIIKLNNGSTSYYPLSVGESTVTTHDIEVKHNIGGYVAGDTIDAVTTFDEIITTLLGTGQQYEVAIDNITIVKNLNDELEVDLESIFADKYCEEVTADRGNIINSISQKDGKVYASIRELTSEDIPVLDTNKIEGLTDKLTELSKPLTKKDIPVIDISQVSGLNDKLEETIPIDRLPSNIPIDKVSGLSDKLTDTTLKDWGYWHIEGETDNCNRVFWDNNQWRYKTDDGSLVPFDSGLPDISDPEAYQLVYKDIIFSREKDVDTKAVSEIELENSLVAKDTTSYDHISSPNSVIGRIHNLEEKVGDTTISEEVKELKGSIKSINHQNADEDGGALIDTLVANSDGKAYIGGFEFKNDGLPQKYEDGNVRLPALYIAIGHQKYNNYNNWITVIIEKGAAAYSQMVIRTAPASNPYDWSGITKIRQLGDLSYNSNGVSFAGFLCVPGGTVSDGIDEFDRFCPNGECIRQTYSKEYSTIGWGYVKFELCNNHLFIFGFGCHEEAEDGSSHNIDSQLYSSLFQDKSFSNKQKWSGIAYHSGLGRYLITGEIGCMYSSDLENWTVINDSRYPGLFKVTYKHGKFIGITPDWKIYTSEDGITWELCYINDSSETLNTVMFGDANTKYFPVTTNDNMLYRINPDFTKTEITLGGSVDRTHSKSILYSDGVFIVNVNTGSASELWYSRNTFNWVKIKHDCNEPFTIHNVCVGEGLIRIATTAGILTSKFNKEIASVDYVDDFCNSIKTELNSQIENIKFSPADTAEIFNTNDIVRVLKSVLLKLGMKDEAITIASAVMNS